MTTLEKIKSEIEAVEPKSHVQYGMRWADSTLMIPFHKVMQILDKYAEQEPNIDMECDEIKILQKRSYLEGFHEAHKMLVKQEPCDDAISREDALNSLIENTDFEGWELSQALEAIEQLPSVTQKSETVTEFADRCRECGAKYGKLLKQVPKTGHWIYDETLGNWRCSKCNETPKTMGYVGTADFMAEHFKFCNHCGAKMVEPTCDTCEYNTAAFMPCNACEDKSEYKPQESEDKE